MTGPDYHQCTDGSRPSDRHPTLMGVGGGALLGGLFGSFAWAVWAVFWGDPTWWVAAPVAVGVVVFIGTALLATVLDQTRKARPRR